MAFRDIVVIGASAGGVEALGQLMPQFPEDFPASIFITVHTTPVGPGYLAGLIRQWCRLPVGNSAYRQDIRAPCVYVARPNLHLVIKRGRVENRFLPKENGTRPAIDPMFRSAAHAYGRRVIGVLLTGNLDDGTSGLGIIKDEGGIVVVQDPKDARYPDMPLMAMARVQVDHVVPLARIAPLLVDLVSQELREEPLMIHEGSGFEEGRQVMTCPGCGGVLQEYRQGVRRWFECQVGHKFSPETLMIEVDREVEEKLWGALVALRQKAEMEETLAADARSVEESSDRSFFEQQAKATKEAEEMLRTLLEEKGPVIFPGPTPKDVERPKKRAKASKGTG